MQNEIMWTIQIRKIERMEFIFTKLYNPLTPTTCAISAAAKTFLRK